MNPTRTLDADVWMDQENSGRPPNGDAGPARRDRDAKQRSARDSFIERVAGAGFRNTRIEDVCRDAGVSPPEFYRWFGNKDQCYLSIFDVFGRSLVDVGRRTFDGTAGPWEEKLRAGLLAVVRELAGDPRQARFLLECHAVNGGEGAMWRLVASVKRVYLTDEVRSQAPPSSGGRVREHRGRRRCRPIRSLPRGGEGRRAPEPRAVDRRRHDALPVRAGQSRRPAPAGGARSRRLRCVVGSDAPDRSPFRGKMRSPHGRTVPRRSASWSTNGRHPVIEMAEIRLPLSIGKRTPRESHYQTAIKRPICYG